MKCAVYNCENHAHEGQFVGLLCSPCHTFISGPFTKGGYSQASRNVKAALEAVLEKLEDELEDARQSL